MTCNRYHLWAALDVHAFSKAEAVLRFSAEEDGMWVQWQDYARLKAELEHMSEHDNDTCPHLVRASLLEAENARLKAEVERLRAASFVTAVPVEQYERVIKAGNAMVLKVPDMMAGCVRAEEAVELMNDWIAAKEGKQP